MEHFLFIINVYIEVLLPKVHGRKNNYTTYPTTNVFKLFNRELRILKRTTLEYKIVVLLFYVPPPPATRSDSRHRGATVVWYFVARARRFRSATSNGPLCAVYFVRSF